MRKDITKKFLMRENRYGKKMLSKGVCSFIFRKKINRDAKQISYDEIEFRNIFSTQFTKLNKNNFLDLKNVVSRNGKTIEFNMIYCAEGIFTMGSNNSKDNNPNRVVEIERPFLLGETEVTQELYELVMGYNPKLVMGYNPSSFKGDDDSSQRPVDRITWCDALMFCNKLSVLLDKNLYYEIKDIEWHNKGKSIQKANVEINEGSNGFRLPSSEEWEYAARAGTNNQYAGTNDKSKLEEYAWFDKNSNNETHPVKQKKPNEWGLYDMNGNVWEWCWSKYDDLTNDRVNRGGGWHSSASILHSTYRTNSSPSDRRSYLGFRISMYL